LKILGVNIKRPFGASHKDVASNGGGFLGGGSGASEYAINDGFVDNFDWLQAEPERLIYNKKHRRMFLARRRADVDHHFKWSGGHFRLVVYEW
jgi:hypothetical protein